MEKKLEEYFNIDAVKALFEKHSEKMGGVWLSLHDANEEIYIDMDVNDICHKHHRVNAETSKLCTMCNKELLKKFYELEYAEYKCGNELLNITMPIKVDDNHIATFTTGQFFIKDEHEPDIELFKARAKQFGFNEEEYLEFYQKMPTYTREQVNEYLTEIRKDLMALIIS